MTPQPESTESQPGAARFWGQFSQSTAGRSNLGESDENGSGSRRQDGDGRHRDDCLDWCPICRSAELFRHAVPPELKQQAESIQHEAFNVLKAFLDAYAAKTNGQPEPAATADPEEPAPQEPTPRVTDIPLD